MALIASAKVIIRVDSSLRMGAGHLMRCLTLAESLRKEEAIITFICRDLPGNLLNLVVDKGFSLIKLNYDDSVEKELQTLPEHQQWLGAAIDNEISEIRDFLQNQEKYELLVVDHYALDKEWESQVRPFAEKIMVIDDLADRKHDCDVLLDQNYYVDMEKRYDELVSEDCIKLLGPRYCLLRDEFLKERPRTSRKLTEVKNILVNFGGGDNKNYCWKLLTIIAKNMSLFLNYNFTFLLGINNSNIASIEKLVKGLDNCKAIISTDSMAKLMCQCDLFIGASGTTSWERACLGIPSLVIATAENQKKIAFDCDGIMHLLVDVNMFFKDATYLRCCLDRVDLLNELICKSYELVDGKGALRVSENIAQLSSVKV